MIKRVSLFNLLFQIRPESQSTSLLYSGGKPALVVTPAGRKYTTRSSGEKVLPSHGVWISEAMWRGNDPCKRQVPVALISDFMTVRCHTIVTSSLLRALCNDAGTGIRKPVLE